MAGLAPSIFAARAMSGLRSEPVDLDHQTSIMESERLRLYIEGRKLHLERFRAGIELSKVHHETRRPFVESGIKFAEITVKSLLVLNGGAALALLAFAGNVATRSGIGYLPKLVPALEMFGWGLTFSVLTPALAYLAQRLRLRPTSSRKWEIAVGLEYWAIVSATMSLIMFSFGMQRAASALM